MNQAIVIGGLLAASSATFLIAKHKLVRVVAAGFCVAVFLLGLFGSYLYR